MATNYVSRAITDVTPAAGGVKASWYGVDVNVSVAKATSVADTTAIGNATITAKNANVSTVGNSTTEARVNTPILTVSAVGVNTNVANAILNTRQTSTASGTSTLSFNVSGETNVISVLNDNSGNGAIATLGGTGFGAGINASLMGGKINIAVADANGSSVAKGEKMTTTTASGNLHVKSIGQSNAVATSLSGSEISAVGVGINVVYAKANGTFDAQVNGI